MTARDTKKRTDQKPMPDMLPPHNMDADENTRDTGPI